MCAPRLRPFSKIEWYSEPVCRNDNGWHESLEIR